MGLQSVGAMDLDPRVALALAVLTLVLSGLLAWINWRSLRLARAEARRRQRDDDLNRFIERVRKDHAVLDPRARLLLDDRARYEKRVLAALRRPKPLRASPDDRVWQVEKVTDVVLVSVAEWLDKNPGATGTEIDGQVERYILRLVADVLDEVLTHGPAAGWRRFSARHHPR